MTTLLLLAFILSFIDRQVLNLLVEPIKADLDLSDIEISLLQGWAFSATYVLLSFPLGRLSDATNRTNLLAAGIAFWTLATMACGLARNVIQLAIARAGVGVGEATLTPTAWSLLADSFPPHKRSLPVSIFLTGPYVGGGLALLFGAQVLSFFAGPVEIGGMVMQPWQMCFILVSTPGLLIVIALAAFPEPKRLLTTAEDPAETSFGDFVRVIKARGRVYAGLWFGWGLLVVMLYGLQAWTPTYLIRVHGWEIGEAGFRWGLLVLVTGSAGVLTGPFIHRWLFRRTGKDHALTVGVVCTALLAPFGMLLLVADESNVLYIIGLLSFTVTVPFALMTTTLQLITPNLFRGRASGVTVIATNIVGLGVGPTFVAFMTETVFNDSNMIGVSMTSMFVIFGLASAACYLIGAGPLARTSPLGEDGTV